MHDDSTVLREKLVSLSPAPPAAVIALLGNPVDRTIEEIEVYYFGVMEQLHNDGTKHRYGVAMLMDGSGNLEPALSWDNFLGVVDRADILNGEYPKWVRQELADYLERMGSNGGVN